MTYLFEEMSFFFFNPFILFNLIMFTAQLTAKATWGLSLSVVKSPVSNNLSSPISNLSKQWKNTVHDMVIPFQSLNSWRQTKLSCPIYDDVSSSTSFYHPSIIKKALKKKKKINMVQSNQKYKKAPTANNTAKWTPCAHLNAHNIATWSPEQNRTI